MQFKCMLICLCEQLLFDIIQPNSVLSFVAMQFLLSLLWFGLKHGIFLKRTFCDV